MSTDETPDHASAFDGVRIIDATEGIGGPYAAMLLAEQHLGLVGELAGRAYVLDRGTIRHAGPVHHAT